MTHKEKILDDVARLAGGAVGILSDAGREVRQALKHRVNDAAQELDLVPREDFEALQEVVRTLRENQDANIARIEALEKKNHSAKRK